MHTALRPYVTTGIAIVGASVLAITPITASPEQLRPVQQTIEVAPTSVVDDLATAIAGITYAAGIAAGAPITFLGPQPLVLLVITQLALEHPELLPDLLSYLAHSVLDPSPQLQISLLYDVTHIPQLTLVGMLSALSPDIGAAAQDGFAALWGVLDDGLALLPDPEAAAIPAIVDVFLTMSDDLRNFFGAVSMLSAAFGGSTYPIRDGSIPRAALFVGSLPAQLVNFIEQAAADPESIPDLVSNTAEALIDAAKLVPQPVLNTIHDILNPPSNAMKVSTLDVPPPTFQDVVETAVAATEDSAEEVIALPQKLANANDLEQVVKIPRATLAQLRANAAAVDKTTDGFIRSNLGNNEVLTRGYNAGRALQGGLVNAESALRESLDQAVDDVVENPATGLTKAPTTIGNGVVKSGQAVSKGVNNAAQALQGGKK